MLYVGLLQDRMYTPYLLSMCVIVGKKICELNLHICGLPSCKYARQVGKKKFYYIFSTHGSIERSQQKICIYLVYGNMAFIIHCGNLSNKICIIL